MGKRWRVMSDLMEFGSRDEFRKWLCDNCLSSAGIWVLFGKAGGPKPKTYVTGAIDADY